jgi:hypothetical protein
MRVAAYTRLVCGLPHTARQAATRGCGRPAPVTRARPVNVPDLRSRGARPACLTTARAEANRARSPVRARIAAAPPTSSPGRSGRTRPTPGSAGCAIPRYKYLLRTAPPEDMERVHTEAFGKLTLLRPAR